MSWEAALFIALPLLFIIGNIMMLKHSANMKMPSLKDHMPDKGKQPEAGQPEQHSDPQNKA